MISDGHAELKERVELLTRRRLSALPAIVENTASFMSIPGGCILRMDERDFFIHGDAYEGRFGLDDQPKYWVKYATDLMTGERKIIKLSFFEQFVAKIGPIQVRYKRSPQKESRVLELVEDHPRFMHGQTIIDAAGNHIRIIERIPGESLFHRIQPLDHEEYYHQNLPQIMQEIIGCIEALALLQRQGEHHGDVRSDHILIDSRNQLYRWIDFDLEVDLSDHDIWNLGNVLNFVIGGDLVTFHSLRHEPERYPHLASSPTGVDALMLQRHRVANLRKVFPYISQELNAILMRYSAQSYEFYEDLDSLIADLRALFPLPEVGTG